MSKAERTREFIIQTAAPIFNIKGYENTSLSDIQKAVKLTKGAIYGNFADKNELAIAAFDYSCSLLTKNIGEVIANETSSARGLLAYANYYSRNWQRIFKSGGCPMLNAAVEADDNLPYLKDYVRTNVKRFIGLLKKTIEKGQANMELRQNADAEEYATLIYSIVEGNILLAKTMNDPKYFKLASNRIKRIIEQELII